MALLMPSRMASVSESCAAEVMGMQTPRSELPEGARHVLIYGWIAAIVLLSIVLWALNLAEVDRVLSKPRRMIKSLRHRTRRRMRC